jgi:energy-coupling factor transporter ATP-binding protein EcfA2
MRLDSVGRTFIYSDLFRQVAANHHSALVGPRGSGKTTLLKMLSLPALLSWRHKMRSSLIDSMDYFSVYAPSDYAWFPDFRLSSRTRHNEEADQLIAASIFRHHLLKAILDATQFLFAEDLVKDRHLKRFALPNNEKKIAAFAEALNDGWSLEAKFVGLFGLRVACSKRIQRLQRLLTESASRLIPTPEILERHEFIGDYFYDDLVTFLDARDNFFPGAPKCCVCFDELEIAPNQIKKMIVKSARSADQRLYIKISASPYDEDIDELYDPRMPMGEHDYTPIILSYARISDARAFSSQLFRAMAAGYGLSITPQDLLGPTTMEVQDEGGQSTYDRPEELSRKSRSRQGYGIGSANQRSFAQLFEKDASFRKYLRERNISNVNKLEQLSERARAQDVRKIVATVAVRNQYFRATLGREKRSVERRLRTLKRIPDIYTGAESVLAICEGNPRWMIGTLKPLFEAYVSAGNSRSVPRFMQAERLTKTIVTFLSLLAAIPASNTADSLESIIDLIERIGHYIENQILSKRFNADPVTTVIVDNQLSRAELIAFGRAINQGAFVLVPDRRREFQLGKIDKYRFRMTHLFAPLYHFPLVLGRSNRLSLILAGVRDLEDPAEPLPYQGLLFDVFQGELEDEQ